MDARRPRAMQSSQRLATISLVDKDEDAYRGMILCGRAVRESRKSCAFCTNRAIVQCDGERCIRQLCDDHRWSSAEGLAFVRRVSANFTLLPRLPSRSSFSGSATSGSRSCLRRRDALYHRPESRTTLFISGFARDSAFRKKLGDMFQRCPSSVITVTVFRL